MRKPGIPLEIVERRRDRLSPLIEGGILIIPAHPEYVRNHDVHFEYRQDSNFFYLTGFEEQESVFVFRPGLQPETVLFVREKDLEKETWDGFRFGPEGTKTTFRV